MIFPFVICLLLFSFSVEGDVTKDNPDILDERDPPAKVLETKEDFDAFVTNDQVIVLGFFKDPDSEEAFAFIKAAEASDVEVQFGITSNVDLMKKVQDKHLIILIKSFDERMNKLEGEITAETVTNFVNSHSFPLMVEFDPETGFKAPINLLLIASAESDNFMEMMNVAIEVAKEFRGDIIRFFYVNTDDEKNRRILTFLEIKEGELPTFCLTTFNDHLVKYKPDDSKLSHANIRSFINNCKSGQVKPHLNSQDLPDDWNANHVKVLVGTNFNEVALDATKDVFINFHAPWIEECKKLAPVWDDLGEALKDNNDIVIAQIDMTNNQVENIQVGSFPTLKLFKAGDNTEVDFTDERTLVNFLEFLGKEEKVKTKEEL